MTKSQKILDTTKVIKSQRQPKNLKKKYSSLLHSTNTQHMESQNARIKDVEYVI